MSVRLNAYLLLADPAWIEASVLSYYDLVDSIIASYDEQGVGWTGRPIETAECIQRLERIDHAKKIRLVPGRYHDIAHDHLLEVETIQRQAALEVAGHGADWVIQLDADEVLLDPAAFKAAIECAADAGVDGLHYPSRWLFARLGRSTYLERATARGRTWPAFPGPVAVRSGTGLDLARIHGGQNFTVSWRRKDPADMRIAKKQSIAHLSTVRSREQMQAKAATSGHSRDFDWSAYLATWERAHRNPLRYAVASYRSRESPCYRIAYVPGGARQEDPWAS